MQHSTSSATWISRLYFFWLWHLLTTKLAQTAVSSCAGLTTATRCFTELRWLPSTSCSASRTMQQGLCCRCRNELMRSLYSRNCTGCPSNSYKIAMLSFKVRSTSTPAYLTFATSSHVSALETLGHQRLQRCCSSRSPHPPREGAIFRGTAPAVWCSLSPELFDHLFS